MFKTTYNISFSVFLVLLELDEPHLEADTTSLLLVFLPLYLTAELLSCLQLIL